MGVLYATTFDLSTTASRVVYIKRTWIIKMLNDGLYHMLFGQAHSDPHARDQQGANTKRY